MGHATRKGLPGNKLAKKVHLGLCGLRNGVGAAGRLALEGKLCNKNKKTGAALGVYDRTMIGVASR